MDYDLRQEATELWQRGLIIQSEGDLASAAALYRQSIAVYPTAEAHTYLGWVHSLQGDLEAGLQECLIAIELDPDFGNPYNDIGCYLMMKGRLDEAIPWLQKAMVAPRYESRSLPYYNMGRIYEKKGRYREAIKELQQALKLSPAFKDAYRLMKRLEASLN